MNKEEYLKWRMDAATCLMLRYNAEDTEKVLCWFDYIKGREERELVGDESVECMLKFVTSCDNFDMYNSLMCRLFIYAPLILKQ